METFYSLYAVDYAYLHTAITQFCPLVPEGDASIHEGIFVYYTYLTIQLKGKKTSYKRFCCLGRRISLPRSRTLMTMSSPHATRSLGSHVVDTHLQATISSHFSCVMEICQTAGPMSTVRVSPTTARLRYESCRLLCARVL
jgi:hypothetical protein